MNTNIKGNIALGQAIAYFTANEYIVSIPLNDCQWYDLIVEKDNVFQTVQVKFTSVKSNNNNYICSLKTTSPSGKILYSVNEKPIDLLFCYCENADMFLIPVKEIKNSSQITLYSQKPTNVNVFDTSNYYLNKKEDINEELKENIGSVNISNNAGIRKVSQYSLQGEFICEYSNCSEAARKLNPDEKESKKIHSIAANIGRAANGGRQTAYGFQWRYS